MEDNDKEIVLVLHGGFLKHYALYVWVRRQARRVSNWVSGAL